MNKLKHIFLITLLGLVLFSCQDDEDQTFNAPVISDFEFGEGSSHSSEPVAYRGGDLHMEANIQAEVNVTSITVTIHGHDLEVGEGETEWDFSQTYTDDKYMVKNPTFHEHIDIPATAPVGEYHVVLEVTDEAGNTTEEEGHLEIMSPVTISEFHMDESVVRGSDFHVDFMIEAIHGIHMVSVDIHAHGLTPGEGEAEWHFDQVFEEGYHGLTEAEFHEHIEVPSTAPAGEYHVVFSVEDEEGNIQEYDTHLDVTAN
ncbi:DUF4625 domain-containing protein [Echinicola vietnamensis]|uniref:Protein containing PKD domain-containing protein n=1 Tax=Echinicola vietnamensis (strain DSM 17526 / LMG 23754 / KMM 6221) TaxID=926556 RepID=L0G606_ECHVK|nr:DUF4625 domain-containing protein [Echinicola vietnamensis]AGA80728.1 hypothetical protein Echvi_4555 [Echinicola vietnamensis DSM 17526]